MWIKAETLEQPNPSHSLPPLPSHQYLSPFPKRGFIPSHCCDPPQSSPPLWTKVTASSLSFWRQPIPSLNPPACCSQNNLSKSDLVNLSLQVLQRLSAPSGIKFNTLSTVGHQALWGLVSSHPPASFLTPTPWCARQPGRADSSFHEQRPGRISKPQLLLEGRWNHSTKITINMIYIWLFFKI